MATMTPEQWRDMMEGQLTHRWMSELGVFDAYFEGDQRLAFATTKFREAFGSMFAAAPDNWMPLVIESSVERLKVQGFRFGKAQSSDEDAWAIWQANDLDSESDMAHTEAVKLKESYWLVAPGKGDDPPTITAEHPSQFIVACSPANRRVRLAAFKKWIERDGFAYCIVYLPEGIFHWRSKAELNKGGMQGTDIQWVADQGASGANPLREVPGIPIRNAPSMLGGGQSDLKVGIPIQDAVNKLLADMLVGSEYQAFPQRVLLGVEIPKDPETGQPIRAAQLQASHSRVWAFANENAKAFEFSAADLTNYVSAREHLIHGLTAKTRTPPHYVLGQIVNASGDALKAAETGLVAKVRKKMPAFEAAHEDMMRLAFKAMGDTERASVKDSEVIWRDPETRSQGELVDALVKLGTIGVPQEVLWEKAGFSPQEIDRMKTMQMTDDLLTPPPPEPPVQADASQNGAAPPPEPAPV